MLASIEFRTLLSRLSLLSISGPWPTDFHNGGEAQFLDTLKTEAVAAILPTI